MHNSENISKILEGAFFLFSGYKRIAVTSDKRFFGGGRVKQVHSRYQRLRSVLQSKGYSGERHLAKIKSKENRFRRDTNHCIAKQIVSTLEPTHLNTD